MQNFALVIDKFVEFFYFLFRQKLLFFLTFFAVIISVFFNLYSSKTMYYGEVDVYEGGDYYFSKLNSI